MYYEKVAKKKIQLEYARTTNQVEKLITKVVTKKHLSDVQPKLGIIYIYAQAEGECWNCTQGLFHNIGKVKLLFCNFKKL